jgi:hypothetical protein
MEHEIITILALAVRSPLFHLMSWGFVREPTALKKAILAG